MFIFYAYETYFKEPGTFRNRFTRYIKSNLGTKGAFDKMSKLIENNNFISLEKADSLMDWDNIKTIQI